VPVAAGLLVVGVAAIGRRTVRTAA
jgi:hypothetical protein